MADFAALQARRDLMLAGLFILGGLIGGSIAVMPEHWRKRALGWMVALVIVAAALAALAAGNIG